MKIVTNLSATVCSVILTSNLMAAESASLDASKIGESAVAREGKRAYVALEPIGLTFLPVQGVRAAYFLSDDLVVEGGYAAGSATMNDWKYKKNIISAKAKYFMGNSFYVDGGLGLEQWNVDYTVLNEGSFSEGQKLKGDVTNLGVEFHIGNQWQWDKFTMGCDWIGGFAALSSKSSFSNQNGLDAYDQKEQEDSIKSNAGGSSMHLTRLYVGWTFM